MKNSSEKPGIAMTAAALVALAATVGCADSEEECPVLPEATGCCTTQSAGPNEDGGCNVTAENAKGDYAVLQASGVSPDLARRILEEDDFRRKIKQALIGYSDQGSVLVKVEDDLRTKVAAMNMSGDGWGAECEFVFGQRILFRDTGVWEGTIGDARISRDQDCNGTVDAEFTYSIYEDADGWWDFGGEGDPLIGSSAFKVSECPDGTPYCLCDMTGWLLTGNPTYEPTTRARTMVYVPEEDDGEFALTY